MDQPEGPLISVDNKMFCVVQVEIVKFDSRHFPEIVLLPPEIDLNTGRLRFSRAANSVSKMPQLTQCPTCAKAKVAQLRWPPGGRRKQEAVLKATAVRSPLPVLLVFHKSCKHISSFIVQIQQQQSSNRGAPGGGGPRPGGEGVPGGRGHFIQLAIYCTTTWCFAPKGLRTINRTQPWMCCRRWRQELG